MSTEDNIPQQDPAEDTREITVKVPAHRAAQFERFHQRFLEMAAHWDAQVGNEDCVDGAAGVVAGDPADVISVRGTALPPPPRRDRGPRSPRPRPRSTTPRWPTRRSPSKCRRTASQSSISGSRPSWPRRRAPVRRAADPRTAAAGRDGPWGHHERRAWTADNLEDARWLYGRLSEPARELFDLLIETPGKRHSGNEIAAKLRIEKGAHGLAGILAWPGRWCAKLGLEFPITTTAREDGGTDYEIEPEIAALFKRARGRRA